MRGSLAGYTDAVPLLRPAQSPSSSDERTICNGSGRAAAFTASNWLLDRGDLNCSGLRADDFFVRAVSLPVHGQSMPLLLSQPADAKPSSTIMLVQGGPYLNVIKGLQHYALINRLLARYASHNTIIVPAYLGTDPLTMSTGDLRRATDKIRAVLTSKFHRASRACVIAYSLGGFITAPLLRGMPDVSFLLLAPIISTPRRHINRMLSAGAHVVPIRLIRAVAEGEDVTMKSSVRAFVDYFGTADAISLAERLGSSRLKNGRMIFESDDLVVDHAGLPQIERIFGAHNVVRIAAGGHAVEAGLSFPAFERR